MCTLLWLFMFTGCTSCLGVCVVLCYPGTFLCGGTPSALIVDVLTKRNARAHAWDTMQLNALLFCSQR